MLKKILEEMPSYKKMHDDIKAMRLISLVAGKEARRQLQEMETNIAELIENAEKFNEYFSDNGWVLYDSISSKLIEKAIQEFENSGYETAEKVLIDYYKTEVGQVLYQLKNGNEELSIRYTNIKQAFDDHIAERYHASVPQFLMIADGAVNDYTKNQGFFAEGTDVDAWDCLVGSSNSLQKLKEIYSKSRKKTNTDPISLPYRNGILHGRDLNYSNEAVSCKCIVLLFAIHDWMINKKNEDKRKEKYEKSLEPASWKEIISGIKRNNEVKEKIQSWEKKEIIIGKDIPRTGASQEYCDYPYIQHLIEAFEMWEKENYGKLALYFDYLFKYEANKNIRPKECRLLFQNKKYKGYELLEVEDRAIALKRVLVNVEWEMNDKIHNEPLEFGLNYQNKNGELAIPPDDEGAWVIIPWKIQGLYKF